MNPIQQYTTYLFYLLIFVSQVHTAEILAIVFTPSFSHQIAFRPIWKELCSRGHHITLLTTDPMTEKDKPENLFQIDLSESYNVMKQSGSEEAIANKDLSLLQVGRIMLDALHQTANWQLSHPEVKNLIQNASVSFDLIMVEIMFPTHLGFIDRFKVPYIGLSSMDAIPRIHKAVGNFVHTSIYPDLALSFAENLNLGQRIFSALFAFLTNIFEYILYESEQRSAKKHFGKDVRLLTEIEKDMDLLFINVNPLLQNLRPLGPNTIQIGGSRQTKITKPLPKEFQIFLENSDLGVIYFSLGSNVKSILIDKSLRKIFLDVFRELPYKIIWKFEEELDNKPKNVFINKWVPQQDLLANEKIVLFITQCGLQSMEESITNNIPMVGLPFFGDQFSNARLLQSRQLGKYLEPQSLTKNNFKEAILEVINNPIYKNGVRSLNQLSNDVQMTGLERAIWWTEYVMRHKGAKHFNNPVVNLPFYQYYMLDVVFIVSLVLITLVYALIRFIKAFIF